MKRIALLSFLVCVPWNLVGTRPHIIETLRTKPVGSTISLCGEQWKIEENSLFLNNTGKVVLLDTIQICGKVVQEYRQTIEIRDSQTSPGRYTYTNHHTTITTRWAYLMSSAWLAGAAALVSILGS